MVKKQKILRLPIKKELAQEEIARIASEDSSMVKLTAHLRERMAQRDITMAQIFNVLKKGELAQTPEWCSENERGWKCNLCKYTSGAKVIVVAKLIEDNLGNKCVVLTTWEDEQ